MVCFVFCLYVLCLNWFVNTLSMLTDSITIADISLSFSLFIFMVCWFVYAVLNIDILVWLYFVSTLAFHTVSKTSFVLKDLALHKEFLLQRFCRNWIILQLLWSIVYVSYWCPNFLKFWYVNPLYVNYWSGNFQLILLKNKRSAIFPSSVCIWLCFQNFQ